MKPLAALSLDYIPQPSRSIASALAPPRCAVGSDRAEFRRLLDARPDGAGDQPTRGTASPAADEGVERVSGRGSKRRQGDSEGPQTGGGAFAECLAGLLLPSQAADPVVAIGPSSLVSIDGVAQEIVRAVSIQQVSGQTTLRLEVSTPQLSRLDLDLKMECGKVSVNMVLADAAEYRIVRAALPELEASLRNKSVNIAPVQVHFRPFGGQTGDPPPQRPPTPPVDERASMGARPVRRPHSFTGSAASRRVTSGTDYVI